MVENAVSWTQKELEKWLKNGLIPQELLEPNRWKDLFSFLKDNKDQLYQQTQGPTTIKREIASHIRVLDEHTGKTTNAPEKVNVFELCDGVKFQVKATEIKDWERETAEAKNLTKKQRKNLRAFVAKFGRTRPLTRKEIVTFIEEIGKPTKQLKYRQSGHLVDEKLKYSPPNQEINLFDRISPETKQKIEESKVEIRAEGIKLTPPENKLLHALNRILHEKSHNTCNPQAEEFYSGNAPGELVPYGPTQTHAPVLKFKPSELYRAYVGHDDYSGHDIQYINGVLYKLEEKRVLIKYDRVKKIKTKSNKIETKTDRIEDFQSLIHIKSFIPDLSDEEKKKLDRGDSSIRERKGELVVVLNPIFTDQIDTKFIEFPVDTNRRLVIAAKGHRNVTASMITLMEWMLREKSSKRYTAEINEEKLPYILGLENYVKQSRKKKLRERITKDIEAITGMGIILRSEKVPNAIGGFKWIFHINKDYD